MHPPPVCLILYLCVFQTLIKIMTGELKASSGIVWRHPNLRVAYVAQHAFHHLEDHQDISPVTYMFKRFGLGLDQVGVATSVLCVSRGCPMSLVWLPKGRQAFVA